MKQEDKYFIYDRPYNSNLKTFIRNCYYRIMALCYKCVYFFIKKEAIVEKKYNVTVCAIFKNEAAYLKEWIEFNRLVGVEHFYLYNNNSDDDYAVVLKPYIEANIVTLRDWPHNQQQMECYLDCVSKYSAESKWIGFIDIDEFIVPKAEDNIYAILKKYENKAGAVLIYWKLFGTSGRINRDIAGLVVEDFTVCWPKYCDIGKCFYNTRFDLSSSPKYLVGLHHRLWTKTFGLNMPPVNIFGHFSYGTFNSADRNDFPIQINHYFTKSYCEYAQKKSKGDVYFNINPHDEEYFFLHEQKCTATDYSAYKYLIKLKKAMQTND